MQALWKLLPALSLVYLTTSGDSCGGTGALEEQEPNNMASQANPLGLDVTLLGTANGADSDWFVLDIPSDYLDHKLTISAVDEDGRCFVGLDPALSLFAADGTTLLAFREDGPEGYCPTLSVVVVPGERYYLMLSVNSGSNGGYTLTTQRGGTGVVGGLVSLATLKQDTARTSGRSGAVASRPVSSGPVSSRPVSSGQVVAGQLILEPTMPLHTPQQLETWLDGPRTRLGLPLRAVRPLLGGRFYLVEAPAVQDLPASERSWVTRAMVGQLEGLSGVRSVSTNAVLKPSLVPDDPDYALQWDFKPYPGMNVEGAWDLSLGAPDTIVGIIDTGHDADHPDLQGKWVPGYDFIADAESAGDGDGPDPDAEDAVANGHGTHVAGTVAASTDNGNQVAGVGWNTRYMPLRVCGRYGCVESDVMDALWYAAGYAVVGQPGQATARAAVVNLSLGGNDVCHAAWQSAISAANARGVLVVVSAGNSSMDASAQVPAACEDVIAVGATNSSGARASFSNFGDKVDVMAPGEGILSTRYGGSTTTLSGTSMSSPHIAGLLALVKDILPGLSVGGALEVLGSGALPVSCTGAPGGCGLGLVDAGAVLAASWVHSDGALPAPLLVQVVDENNPGRVLTAAPLNDQYQVEGLSAGTYRVQAGEDRDGDGVLGEPGEAFGVSTERFTITSKGEERVVDVQVLPGASARVTSSLDTP